MGLKTLLYRIGSELCLLVGDRVLPTSKALSDSGTAGGSVIVLGLRRDAEEAVTCGEMLSGSSAAPGSFREGGGRFFSVGDTGVSSSLGGLPTMLP